MRKLIVFLGINDIQQPPSQPDPGRILQACEQLVRRAHDHDLEVIGTTIPPCKGWPRYTPELNQTRNKVNATLRQNQPNAALNRDQLNAALRRDQLNAGVRPDQAGRRTDLPFPGFDRLVDVDVILRDPAGPARLHPTYNSGDGLHPNPTGAKAIAQAF